MKVGDRVVVVATDYEYSGCFGSIREVTKDGRVVVDVDAKTVTWKATFQPHDIDLARRKRK
jgi:hypothetical protein